MTYTIRPDTQGDTLVSSRNPIRTNFEVIQDRWEVNHEEINVGGKHIFVEMPNQASIPTPLAAGESTIYAKAVNSNSQIFFTPDATGNEIQMTRMNTANFATFATNTVYQANRRGGWTFLPGGMLLNYGLTEVQQNATDININFPRSYTNVPYSVTFSPARDTGTSPGTTYEFNLDISNLGTSSFRIKNHGSPAHSYRFSWIAIGV